MDFPASLAKLQQEKTEVLMLKESFHQLEKLQEECNEELSNFQRENFIAHEEFRAITTHLSESISSFGEKINSELDTLMLRINHLETIALHAFQINTQKVVQLPGSHFVACSQQHIYLAMTNGTIQSFSSHDYSVSGSISPQSYDPLGSYGKITNMVYTEKLYVGFYSGNILVFNDWTLMNPSILSYMSTSVTAIHQFGDIIATGSSNGLVVLWSANTLERLVIFPGHRLSIASIIDDGTDLIIAGRTGIVTKHDKLCSKQNDKLQLGNTVHQLFSFQKNRYITLSDKLLVWEGRRTEKTFDAVEVGKSPLCCIKPPELVLLGSKHSTELKFIYLQSLLFPKVINVLDSPPLSMLYFGSSFYVLTKNGSVFILRPGI